MQSFDFIFCITFNRDDSFLIRCPRWQWPAQFPLDRGRPERRSRPPGRWGHDPLIGNPLVGGGLTSLDEAEGAAEEDGPATRRRRRRRQRRRRRRRSLAPRRPFLLRHRNRRRRRRRDVVRTTSLHTVPVALHYMFIIRLQVRWG